MTRKKRLQNMNATELADATKEFDQEHVADSFLEMTPEEEVSWRAATAKHSENPSLPDDEEVTVISLGIEAGLLKKADAVAKKRGISRARLVAEGLEKVLGK